MAARRREIACGGRRLMQGRLAYVVSTLSQTFGKVSNNLKLIEPCCGNQMICPCTPLLECFPMALTNTLFLTILSSVKVYRQSRSSRTS
eukprot:45279-Hanusia_phi.AAC.3